MTIVLLEEILKAVSKRFQGLVTGCETKLWSGGGMKSGLS